jgi:hypothetical protein
MVWDVNWLANSQYALCGNGENVKSAYGCKVTVERYSQTKLGMQCQAITDICISWYLTQG